MTARTMFQACSISKPLSVYAVMLLAESGRLDLDVDVRDYIEDAVLESVGKSWPCFTLRQIASHTAGLTPSGFDGYPAGVTVPNLMQVLAGAPPANSGAVRAEYEPGRECHYSGGGTTVLQLVLESVLKIDVASLLDALVIHPAGMKDSTFAQPLPTARVGSAALGHLADGTTVPGGWHTYPEQCAAGLWTTPTDLVRFVKTTMLGQEAGVTALGRCAAQRMLQSQIELSPSDHHRSHGFNAMGLGFFLQVKNGGVTMFGHAGANAGFRCYLKVNLATDSVVAVMTNSDHGEAIVRDVLRALELDLG